MGYYDDASIDDLNNIMITEMQQNVPQLDSAVNQLNAFVQAIGDNQQYFQTQVKYVTDPENWDPQDAARQEFEKRADTDIASMGSWIDFPATQPGRPLKEFPCVVGKDQVSQGIPQSGVIDKIQDLRADILQAQPAVARLHDDWKKKDPQQQQRDEAKTKRDMLAYIEPLDGKYLDVALTFPYALGQEWTGPRGNPPDFGSHHGSDDTTTPGSTSSGDKASLPGDQPSTSDNPHAQNVAANQPGQGMPNMPSLPGMGGDSSDPTDTSPFDSSASTPTNDPTTPLPPDTHSGGPRLAGLGGDPGGGGVGGGLATKQPMDATNALAQAPSPPTSAAGPVAAGTAATGQPMTPMMYPPRAGGGGSGGSGAVRPGNAEGSIGRLSRRESDGTTGVPLRGRSGRNKRDTAPPKAKPSFATVAEPLHELPEYLWNVDKHDNTPKFQTEV